ncbi:MAG: helix-turn-helix transcriptional regulator [Oscillospiraceae bacterium]
MRIIELCREHDMTQAELARRLELDPSTVAKWAAGVSVPRMSALMAMRSVFGCTLDELMDQSAHPSNPGAAS